MIIVISWRVAADIVRAFVDVLELVTLMYAGRVVQQRSTATALTAASRT
ncbi:hypothetical protein [Streptomyces sp. NPDC015242]